MQSTESPERTAEISGAALELMARHGIAADPQNFAVFFGYCSSRNATLVSAVDALLSDGTKLTAEHCRALYDEHFGVRQEAGEVEETGRRIQATLGGILDSLGQAGLDQSDYGEKLVDFSAELTGTAAGEGLALLVSGILSETQAIMAKNQALESRLGESSREIESLRGHLVEVRREAMTDALTGIANRKYFDNALVEATEEARETVQDLCLLLVDIDHFKTFNDTYGHRVGDEVLRVVARTLKDGIKGRDTAARYGGEEFAVILPRTGLAAAATVAEQIRTSLASRKLQNRRTGDSYGTVTVSIGVARYRPGEARDELVERVDRALYCAKDEGRNRVVAEVLDEQIAGLAG